MICHRCGKQRVDGSTPPMPRCKCHRIRLDLDGGHMDVSLTGYATPETIDALKELGRIVVERMRSGDWPPAPADKATT